MSRLNVVVSLVNISTGQDIAIWIDDDNLTVHVEAGIVGQYLERQVCLYSMRSTCDLYKFIRFRV